VRIAEWDYENRMLSIENQFQSMAKRMEGTISEKEGLQDSIGQFKTRSTSSPTVRISIQALQATALCTLSNQKLTFYSK
jgi:hypothetical protein